MHAARKATHDLSYVLGQKICCMCKATPHAGSDIRGSEVRVSWLLSLTLLLLFLHLFSTRHASLFQCSFPHFQVKMRTYILLGLLLTIGVAYCVLNDEVSYKKRLNSYHKNVSIQRGRGLLTTCSHFFTVIPARKEAVYPVLRS